LLSLTISRRKKERTSYSDINTSGHPIIMITIPATTPVIVLAKALVKPVDTFYCVHVSSFAVRIRLNTDPNLTPNPIRTHDCVPNSNRQNYDMNMVMACRLVSRKRFVPFEVYTLIS